MSSLQDYNVTPTLTPVRVVATSNQSGTYYNGPLNNGVDATFTYATGSLVIDSVTVNIGDSVILVGQSSGFQNGIYVCTQQGITGVAAVLERRDDFQSLEQIFPGQYVSVEAGSVNGGAIYTVVEPKPQILGISNLVFNGAITSGLGTASTKAASSNSESTVASVHGSITSGNLASYNDTSGTVNDSGIAAVNVLQSSLSSPDTAADIIYQDVVVGQAALATAGHVTLQASSGSKQYKIRGIAVNKTGTNFSGGGGDRNLSITDGTSVWTIATAALIQSLANTRWGDSALPVPASVSFNTSSVAGTTIYAAYSGGTTDYTAGSLTLTLQLQRVA